MRRRGAVAGFILASGLALMPAPLFAKSQAAAPQQVPATLPADPGDFVCFTLLQQRRDAYLQADQTNGADAQIVSNLTVISAFYAGRLTHYPASQADAEFADAEKTIAASSAAQLDATAKRCSDFYLQVMTYLGQVRASTTP